MPRYDSIHQARQQLRQRNKKRGEPVLARLLARFTRRGRASARQDRGRTIPVGMGLWGSNLTFFHGADGSSISLHGPPVPLHESKPRTRTFAGRDMTRHLAPDNRLTVGLQMLARNRNQVPLLQRSLQAVWRTARWLFSVNPRLQIIERYVWGEAFGFFLVGALGFTFFMIITTIFSLGEKIFSKHIPPFTIAKVMLLSAPQFLVLAIPVAVLFSTLMAMGRLNRDNEIIAMTTNGVSLYRLFLPYIAISIGAGILTWTIYEHIVPPYTHETRETLKVFWQAEVVDFIKPGIIIKAPDRKYFYVDHINKTEGQMYGLRLYDYMDEDGRQRMFPRMFLAEQAYVEDDYLVLNKVKFYELDKRTGATLVEAKMPQVKIDIATKINPYTTDVDPLELTSGELRTKILHERDKLKATMFVSAQTRAMLNRDWTAYYFKFSVPMACLAFVLVAVPVSLRGPRDERNLGIIMSFALVMVYYIFFFVCREVGGRGIYITKDVAIGGVILLRHGVNLFPPYIAGWLSPMLFMLASTVLIARARR